MLGLTGLELLQLLGDASLDLELRELGAGSIGLIISILATPDNRMLGGAQRTSRLVCRESMRSWETPAGADLHGGMSVVLLHVGPVEAMEMIHGRPYPVH